MPAHLARHTNMTHGGGVAKKKVVKPKRGVGRPKGSKNKPKVGRPGAAFVAGQGRAADLLGDMRALHADLTAQRNALNTEIAAVAAAMRVMRKV